MNDMCNHVCMTNGHCGFEIPRTDKFGARLALLRWHMKWNQKEAAASCGISQASWRGWESDGREPRDLVGTVEKICAATGVDEYWMLTGKERVA